MAFDNLQNADSIQKLVGSFERKIGISRLTKNTISDGPDILSQRAFNSTITQFVDSMIIYDSLDGAFRMADMVITDPISFRATAPLTGHEIISVSYSNGLSTSSTKPKIIHFMIHNITEDIDSSSTTVNIKKLLIKLIEFPAFEMISSNQYYKTYPIDEKNTPKQRFSDIVKDMLNGIEDFTKWYDIEIEDSTKNAVNTFIPNWIPLKVINYCKKHAISEKKKYPMYVFHIGSKADSDKPVAYFKPVYSFVDNVKKYRAYGHSFNEVQSGSDDRKGTYSPVDTILEHSFEYFDAQNVGTLSGETGVIFDYLEDNTYITNDYDTYLNSIFKGMSPYPIYPFGHGNHSSGLYRTGWNYAEGKENIKNCLHNKYANGMLSGGVKCKAMAYVFESRECGERAELIFNIVSKDSINDKMMSGAWITWAITDTFIGGQAFSTITFYNDGFNEIIDQTNTFSKINTITGTNAPESVEQ